MSQALWARQLRLQAKLSAAQDEAFWKTLPGWRAARRVLDLGCGTGDYLRALAAGYPEKQFTGLDRDRHLLAWLKNRRIRILRQDVRSLRPPEQPFDFAIARLLVQHLPSAAHLFSAAGKALEPGGYLLVLDADDRELHWHPRLPTVESALHRLAREQKRHGAGRDPWRELDAAARKHRFRKLLSKPRRYRSLDDKKLFHEIFANLGELLPRALGVSLDEQAYQRELREWRRNAHAHACFGMRAALYKRED